MAEYISTFTTGFSDVIPMALQKLLPGAKVLQVYDGLVNYIYDGKGEQIQRVLIFNNTFFVVRKYQGKSSEMGSMVQSAMALKRLPPSKGTFRIRYSVNNQFVGMNKAVTRRLEDKISQFTGSRIDRVSPQTEYWFIQRSENVGFFGRLLNKRKVTEKSLHKGELRPEFAYFMCMLGGLDQAAVVLDPFAGYGAIAKQIRQSFPYRKMLVSDLNRERVTDLAGAFQNVSAVWVACRDALCMDDIGDCTVDAIITDPPWGYYEEIEDIKAFYVKMLAEFDRVQKPGGVMVILSARKAELEAAVCESGLRIRHRYDTLVNGKKAAVYVVKK